MTKRKMLEDAFRRAVRNWEGDFDFDIEDEDMDDETEYFSVVIEHKFLGDAYQFAARVTQADECEMNYNDGEWTDINMGNLFAWMWFETAADQSRRG